MINKPPLWKLIKAADASWTSDLITPEARMIQAVRDWLLPEEPLYDSNQRWEHERDERQRLRALLTIEIDRAENSDS